MDRQTDSTARAHKVTEPQSVSHLILKGSIYAPTGLPTNLYLHTKKLYPILNLQVASTLTWNDDLTYLLVYLPTYLSPLLYSQNQIDRMKRRDGKGAMKKKIFHIPPWLYPISIQWNKKKTESILHTSQSLTGRPDLIDMNIGWYNSSRDKRQKNENEKRQRKDINPWKKLAWLPCYGMVLHGMAWYGMMIMVTSIRKHTQKKTKPWRINRKRCNRNKKRQQVTRNEQTKRTNLASATWKGLCL